MYYMIGEDKTDGAAFQNINCYSSTNLVDWKFKKALLTKTASGDLGPNRIIERPKIIYNEKTSKYVMYMHIDDSDYKEAKVGVATSSCVCGSYKYHGSFNPLGQQSRDIGLYKDDDKTAYLLTEDVCIRSSCCDMAWLIVPAGEWPSYCQVERRLSQRHRQCPSMAREYRVSGIVQEERLLLYVWFLLDGLGSE